MLWQSGNLLDYQGLTVNILTCWPSLHPLLACSTAGKRQVGDRGETKDCLDPQDLFNGDLETRLVLLQYNTFVLWSHCFLSLFLVSQRETLISCCKAGFWKFDTYYPIFLRRQHHGLRGGGVKFWRKKKPTNQDPNSITWGASLDQKVS